jgi:hypothetical protein
MPVENEGVFKIDYSMFISAEPEHDLQFGMDFSLTNEGNLALTQLIFPATSVGNNTRGQWNIDNHSDGHDSQSLIFQGAENGIIHDTPREISSRGNGVKSTKFAVYRVDLDKAIVQTTGVSFSYEINTDDEHPITVFKGFNRSIITNEQKQLISGRCHYVKFT